jgi:hypothetical protein
MPASIPITKLLRERTAAALREAAAAQQRGDIAQKVDWDTRSRYLRELDTRFQSLADPDGRAVFVSYSVGRAQVYFELLKRGLQQSKFEVVTGFDRVEGDRGHVLARVRAQLARCHIYVAILTRELKVMSLGGETRWAPSVWTVEEKGMALGLDKPFVLMVEEGIHEDFWRKTTPERVHVMFNDGTALTAIEKVRDAVTEHYIEAALRTGRVDIL